MKAYMRFSAYLKRNSPVLIRTNNVSIKRYWEEKNIYLSNARFAQILQDN
jgi:hypothetical protein